jgi:hypothetical protein
MHTRLGRRTISLTSIALLLGTVAVWGPPASASVPGLPACSAGDLTARVTGTGEGMSQPAAYVTVTNRGSASCTVRGYPTITMVRTKKSRQAFTVTKDAVQNAPKPKPRRIVLAPGGHAWFAVGTATAYDPPVVTLTRIAFTTMRGGGRATATVSLPASAPTGQSIPVGVTAFAPGIGRSE